MLLYLILTIEGGIRQYDHITKLLDVFAGKIWIAARFYKRYFNTFEEILQCEVRCCSWLQSGPTPAFSGVAGDLHRPARATVCHEAKRSRPDQGPRQRRPLQSNVGPLP